MRSSTTPPLFAGSRYHPRAAAARACVDPANPVPMTPTRSVTTVDRLGERAGLGGQSDVERRGVAVGRLRRREGELAAAALEDAVALIAQAARAALLRVRR